jgi:hypothetical protein
MTVPEIREPTLTSAPVTGRITPVAVMASLSTPRVTRAFCRTSVLESAPFDAQAKTATAAIALTVSPAPQRFLFIRETPNSRYRGTS